MDETYILTDKRRATCRTEASWSVFHEVYFHMFAQTKDGPVAIVERNDGVIEIACLGGFRFLDRTENRISLATLQEKVNDVIRKCGHEELDHFQFNKLKEIFDNHF